MNLALRQPWTLDDFLSWEEAQDLRYEFDGIRPVGMTGGTLAHDRIQVNLVTELTTRLRGKPCRAHGNSLKIQVMGSLRYPDAFVTCTPARGDATVVTEPVVIFEVLSKHPARTDRMVKNREYAGTASVRRYVMLEQTAIEGMMFSRTEDGADWVGHFLDADAVLRLPEIGIDLPLAALYDNVEFVEPEDESA
jgi:Uma2 family endonuclease